MPSRSRSAGASASSSKGGKLSDVESKLYSAALAGANNTITQDELDSRFKDVAVEDRLVAINGLLRKVS